MPEIDPHHSDESDLPKKELAALLAAMPAFNSAKEKHDALDGFTLRLGEMLPMLSTESATAYAVDHAAHAGEAHYAIVCAAGMPLRLKAIDACRTLHHADLVNLVAADEIWISTLNEKRMALVFERPKGQPLRALIAENKRYPERFIIDQILAPLVKALTKLSESGTVHGRLHLSNIYYSDRTVLGECLSEPCGYSQAYLYEPPERMSVLPYAKGEANLTVDCYALGIIALQLVTGKELSASEQKAEFIQRILHEGTIACLIGNEEFSEHFQDFFRGVLADNAQERWGLSQVKSWLDGKRFNLMHAGAPRDAGRPYMFGLSELGNMRAIAHAYFTQWNAARTDLQDNKLRRWVSTSAHRKETAEALQRIANAYARDASHSERSGSELVSRSLLFLDPRGPLRYKTISTEFDGLGGVVAHAYRHQSQEQLQAVADMIDMDLITSWSGVQKEIGISHEIAGSQMWKLQRVRLLLRVSSLGSGMERCLYDLNPTLACQSPYIASHHALTPAAALNALDKVARQYGPQGKSPVDRHVAAFLCSHQDITKDVRITALSFAPGLMTNPDLIALELLRATQSKIGNVPLIGLTLWAANGLIDVIDKFHSRVARHKLRAALTRAAQTGMFSKLSDVMLNVDLIRDDETGFAVARQHYQQLAGRIAYFNNVAVLTARSKDWGARIAFALGLILLVFVTYHTFGEQM